MKRNNALTSTVTKQANQLNVGDVIIDPSNSRHVVTDIVHHGLAGAWLSIHTDTGLKLDKSQDESKLDTYDVLAAEDHT
ncbi:hypothetical protein [Mycolicibacterium conceptionense]|uniref:hypothetical protein n=1 Tax=Mycolicibacterium conceptionense TaxID=451644 RepID=UPI003204D6BD